ncbi:MAG TPA: 4a-hydroxytetrahydrobiopterin dehydratase [Candidatus Polarisedimenticolia bacterium]|nr:4a-hydroxytetrahydrobiopterin dehydratase [Candidatus Polarisedimenticolia bacterium]
MDEPKRQRPRLLSAGELERAMSSLAAWRLEGGRLVRDLEFPSFAEAMRFVHRAAEEAERMDHHPDMLISYRRVTLTLWSHDAGGATWRDLELASRLDAAAAAQGKAGGS